MYNDKSLKIDFWLPDDLREEIKKVEDAYEHDDGLTFNCSMEFVEMMAKSYYMAGKIDGTQLSLIKNKFGGWG